MEKRDSRGGGRCAGSRRCGGGCRSVLSLAAVVNGGKDGFIWLGFRWRRRRRAGFIPEERAHDRQIGIRRLAVHHQLSNGPKVQAGSWAGPVSAHFGRIVKTEKTFDLVYSARSG